MIRHRPLPLLAVVLVVALVAAACSSRSASSSRSSITSIPTLNPAPAGTEVPPAAVRPAVKPTGATTDATIRTADGRDRTYHLYVPATLPAGTVPLLVALHGGGGWGAQFEANSGFDGLAEANGFLVVYPDGLAVPALGQGRVWNGGACCGPAAQDRLNVDDVAFISSVIDQVEAAHAVDPTRVYAAGHSNGAIMSYRLACELADRIVAIGVQAGSLEIDACHPSHPVSVLEIHGTADTNIPIDGGRGTSGISQVDFNPPGDAVQAFVGANGCPAPPAVSVDAGNADVTSQTWGPCAAGSTVRWTKVAGANHAWMGHTASAGVAERVGGEPYAGLDATLTIWTFLSAQRRS